MINMEERYLLIWTIDGYPEDGGGLYFDTFESEAMMKKRIGELATQYKELLSWDFCCEVKQHFNIVPKETVVRYELE